MKGSKACDTHRLILIILGLLGVLSLGCYVLIKVGFDKEPSELLLSGGFCAVITGLLGNMGRGATAPTNSGVILNEAPKEKETE
jgi:hypothetical protein